MSIYERVRTIVDYQDRIYPSDELTMVIEGDKGAFHSTFPELENTVDFMKSTPLLDVTFLNSYPDYEIYLNKNSDIMKVKLETITNLDTEIEALKRNIHQSTKVGQQSIYNRISLIYGFTMCALLPGTNITYYKKNRTRDHFLASFGHLELKDLLFGDIVLNNDIDQDFITVLENLWFNFPYDITGYDDEINELLLSNGIKVNERIPNELRSLIRQNYINSLDLKDNLFSKSSLVLDKLVEYTMSEIDMSDYYKKKYYVLREGTTKLCNQIIREMVLERLEQII